MDEPLHLPIDGFLDLHAFAPRDVPSVVADYLEAAAAAGLAEVRLVHGRGIGVQRAAVHRVLRGHPLVVHFRDAPEAHLGATVARLRGAGEPEKAPDGGVPPARSREPAAARLINGERIVVLGWGRAILMQFAHPLVAAGVDDHSTFRTNRRARFLRLHQTVQAMLDLTFGSEAVAARTADNINTIHDRVHGTLREPIGRLPAGTAYSAHDPALLLWVHATLLDSLPLAYERLVGPLPPEVVDAYCEDAATGAARLGLHGDVVPRTSTEVRAYIEGMLASGPIAVSRAARALADDVLHPPFRWLAGPAGSLHRLFSIGTLPPAIREGYGFAWDAGAARRLDRLTRAARALRRLTPNTLARFRAAR